MQVGNGPLQVSNYHMSANNGIDSGKNIKLQTVAWLWQAYNCLLQLNNDSLQANEDIDVVNNARLQAGKVIYSVSRGILMNKGLYTE